MMAGRRVACTVCGVTLAVGAGIWLVKRWSNESVEKSKSSSGKLRGVERWIRINHVKLTQLSIDILKSIGKAI